MLLPLFFGTTVSIIVIVVSRSPSAHLPSTAIYFTYQKALTDIMAKRGGTQLGNVVVWCSAGMPTDFHLLVTTSKTDRRADRRIKASEILFLRVMIKN